MSPTALERRPAFDDEDVLAAVERDGFAIVEKVLGRAAVARLALVCDEILAPTSSDGRPAGVRNILSVPAIKALSQSAVIRNLAAAVIGEKARATRGILFDKRANANWAVLWHQDLSLAVAERVEVPGWAPWSIKGGVHHVQPPAIVLERMMTLRIHVDDCNVESGPLRVVPGSHRMGRLSTIALRTLQRHAQLCTARAGDVLAMRPLLVHSSSSATRPTRRRVIHLEYIDPAVLPAGIRLCDA